MSSSPLATADAIRVLVADSFRMQAQLLTSALRRRTEFRVVTCPMNTTSIRQFAATTPVDVALLALNHSQSPSEDLAVLRGLHLSHPSIAKVLLVESYDHDLVVSAFRSGARGIFSIADTPFRALSKCLHCVAGGQIWANTRQVNCLLDLLTQAPSLRVVNSRGDQLLTPREAQVVALVTEGLGNRQIAMQLSLSEHTVKKYLFHIFDKLGISTRVELVLYAVSQGDPRHSEWMAGATALARSATVGGTV
jgi:DNA-binding NarL/FixJ family response regulator